MLLPTRQSITARSLEEFLADDGTASGAAADGEAATGASPPARAGVATHVRCELEGSCWPDPEPVDRTIRLNDVSRMSSYPQGTEVGGILFPRSEADVVSILGRLGQHFGAHGAAPKVGIRGTKHSMGGQSIVEGGYVLDTKCMRRMEYDPRAQLLTCGPGCLWADLIQYLNRFGKSPRSMQSYCTFSVGGTLAVNAHGITTDHCFAECVTSFRLARLARAGADAGGSGGWPSAVRPEVVACTRPRGSGARGDSEELFQLALGGYGCFGVITEVTMRVRDNVALQMDSFSVALPGGEERASGGVIRSEDFEQIYGSVVAASAPALNGGQREEAAGDVGSHLPPDNAVDRVEIKLARLNIITLSSISVYVFRPSSVPIASPGLGLQPRQLSTKSRVLYKWAMPAMKEARYAMEEASGVALDWSSDDGLTRNQLLYESAVPLAQLYEPLFHRDDTFILQEFFVPHPQFNAWLNLSRPIYGDLNKEDSGGLILLNTTIRFVQQDTDTYLRYSRSLDGVYAFVLYYRLPRGPKYDELLGTYHNRFAEVTVQCGGTFYLPYRKCYSHQLFQQAYPMAEGFAALKEKHDPAGVFSNLWFEHYVLPLCSPGYRDRFSAPRPGHGGLAAAAGLLGAARPPSPPVAEYRLPRSGAGDVVLRRSGSYRALMRDAELRERFRDEFLVNIFSIADKAEVMREIGKACWDPRNLHDFDIFCALRRHFHGACAGTPSPLAVASKGWNAIRQLTHQKQEFVRETASIVGKLGKFGRLHDHVSVGDHGKTVPRLRDALSMRGRVWIVHDQEPDPDSLACVLERGTLDTIGDFVHYDYTSPSSMALGFGSAAVIPDESVDLVTIHQGLHHMPLDELPKFLKNVERILRPGGLFLVREHDLRLPAAMDPDGAMGGQAEYPMLDLAHSVFNAVTGVTLEDEQREIRAFRPVAEWREVVEGATCLKDSMLYEWEAGDPTWDEMLCFYRPPLHAPCPGSAPGPCRRGRVGDRGGCEGQQEEPPILPLLRTLAGQAPAAAKRELEGFLDEVGSSWLPCAEGAVRDLLQDKLPRLIAENLGEGHPAVGMLRDTVAPMVERVLAQARATACRLSAMLENTEVQEVFDFKGLLDFPELFLILPALDRKVRRADAAAKDVPGPERMLVEVVRRYLPIFLISSSAEKELAEGVAAGELPTSTAPAWAEPSGSDDVTGEEVRREFRDLERLFPQLLDPATLANSGFSLRQQSALVTQFGGADFDSAGANLAWYLDRHTWDGIRKNARLACERRSLPTKELVLGETPAARQHPWHFAVLWFLKAPRVTFRPKAKVGLSLLGLGEVVALWQRCQEQAQAERGGGAEGGAPARAVDVVDASQALPSALSGEQLEGLEACTAQLEGHGPVVTATISFAGAGPNRDGTHDLYDVAEVLEATFGYTSITSRPTDITQELRSLHGSCQAHSGEAARLANEQRRAVVRGKEAEEYQQLNARAGGGQPASAAQSLGAGLLQDDAVRMSHKSGWLQLNEDSLKRMRNRCNESAEVMDDVRQGLWKMATVGQAGRNVLTLKYRKLSRLSEQQHTAEYAELANKLCAILRCSVRSQDGEARDANGTTGAAIPLVRDLHRQDGEYTWFKLSEWMQVEIIDIFAKSLDHTPWFRFPFKDFLRIYFRVLLQEASVVEAKLGFMKAYFSSAFITDLIPGVVMAVLFGQLQWLAAPLVATQSGYEDQDKERLLEELVLHHPPAIDHSIFGEGGTALTPKGGMERQRCGKAFRPEISLGSRGTDTITAQAELNVQRQQRERTEGSQTAQGRGPIPFSSASDQRNSSLGQFWYSIHPSIAQVRRISPTLSVVATPPFKTMGDVLLNIAVRIPGATCLQISNQSEVQVRISVNTVVEDAARGCASGTEGRAPTSGGEAGGIAKEQQDRIAASIREKLERNRGVKVLSTYSYPLDGPHPKQAPPKLQMALGVQAPQLLCLIRDCIAQGICVEQIYDFWCG